jgi:hypothetical protein
MGFVYLVIVLFTGLFALLSLASVIPQPEEVAQPVPVE